MIREIEITADGSATLFVPSLDEHYHSVKGALSESRHIYIECGLLQHTSPKPKVLEVGFGTGLNALLTAMHSEKEVYYNTLELYPLDEETIRQLNYRDILQNGELWQKLHNAPWDTPTAITPQFTLNKMHRDFTSSPLPQGIDVVYFDAFAPEKQPDMWTEECFAKIFECMASGGILTTYCAKGVVRRTLQHAGFAVERLAGPPGGKREILRATKP